MWQPRCDTYVSAFARAVRRIYTVMALQLKSFATTYEYTKLPPRYIRLLELTSNATSQKTDAPNFEYRIVQVELPIDRLVPAFEAVSYTWGDHAKVSSLQLQNGGGHIALTANLTEALPHVSRHSSTRRLWIDQICINQADDLEKSIQVGFMAEVYSKAT